MSTNDVTQGLTVVADDPDAIPRVEVGGAILQQISCRKVIGARLRDETPPECAWERDSAGGYHCTAKDCGRWIGPDMARHDVLASLFGDEDSVPVRELTEQNLMQIEREIAYHAGRMSEMTGLRYQHCVLRASALLLAKARRLE